VDTRIKSYTDEKCTNDGFEESVWVIVEVRKKSKLLVGLCYRSPGSEEFNNDKLLKVLQLTYRKGEIDRVLILGDFNYPEIN
jgi:hypothetical protein